MSNSEKALFMKEESTTTFSPSLSRHLVGVKLIEEPTHSKNTQYTTFSPSLSKHLIGVKLMDVKI